MQSLVLHEVSDLVGDARGVAAVLDVVVAPRPRHRPPVRRRQGAPDEAGEGQPAAQDRGAGQQRHGGFRR